MAQRTPLYHHHLQLGARMVEFAGWDMPVQYSGVVEEHLAVRHRAGLCDVSHMGEFEVQGPGALAFLQAMTVNDVATLRDGQAHYSLLLNEQGCILDDIIIYRRTADRYLIVVNAGNLEGDWHWLLAHQTPDIELRNLSRDTALLALQGPAAEPLLQPLCTAPLATLKRFTCAEAAIAGIPVTVARTGYTGSPGFEIFCASASAGPLWQQLLEAGKSHGLKPCGLAARDTLRLEMGYPLHGHDITDKTSPLETRLQWVVKLEKGEFLGRAALQRQLTQGLKRTLCGFKMIDPGIPREGYPLVHGSRPVGFVTSGTMSPLLKQGIGMGMMPIELAQLGTRFSVDIRGKERIAEAVALPFVTPPTIVT